MTNLIALADEMGFEYLENEPMSMHTTFKIGGEAKLMLFPENEHQIGKIIKTAKEKNIRLMVMGNGSNMLVADDGLNAAVMVLGQQFSDVKVNGNEMFVQAGASLTKLCKAALEASLSGLEFAYGIPGSCGGAAFMNAGAYGGEMKNVLYKCSHVNENGEEGFLQGDDLKLAYRHSAYYDNGCIITGLHLRLKHGNKEEISAKMSELMDKRKDKQPLEYPSAGSTFKRPEGHFAGALIEQCGLKGKTFGGAAISEKHAGFVINNGNATCKDVLDLCEFCKETVKKNTGVDLEMEIRVTR